MDVKSQKTTKKDQLIKQVITVQTVHYHCPNCNEEEEEVKLCKSCKAPMRVIQVTEKFGDEAEKYLETLRSLPNVTINIDNGEKVVNENVTVDNALATNEELEKLDEIENGYSSLSITPKGDDEMMEEFVSKDSGIFGGFDDEEPTTKKPKDIEDILAGLDETDETTIDPNTDFSDEEFDSLKDL